MWCGGGCSRGRGSWGDEHVLEPGRGAGCAASWLYHLPPNCWKSPWASEWLKRQVSCPEFAALRTGEEVRCPGERGRGFITECFQVGRLPGRLHRKVSRGTWGDGFPRPRETGFGQGSEPLPWCWVSSKEGRSWEALPAVLRPEGDSASTATPVSVSVPVPSFARCAGWETVGSPR